MPSMDERRHMGCSHAAILRAKGRGRRNICRHGYPPHEGRASGARVSACFSAKRRVVGLKRSIPVHLALSAIRMYQRLLSPFLGKNCRFVPTCSAYTFEAIERYGLIEGILLGTKRILRCGPWSPGGFDPVPDLRRPPGSEKIRKTEPEGR